MAAQKRLRIHKLGCFHIIPTYNHIIVDKRNINLLSKPKELKMVATITKTIATQGATLSTTRPAVQQLHEKFLPQG